MENNYSQYIKGHIVSYKIGNKKKLNLKVMAFLFLFLMLLLLTFISSFGKISLILFLLLVIGGLIYFCIDDALKKNLTTETEATIIGYKEIKTQDKNKETKIQYSPVYLLNYNSEKYVLFSRKKLEVVPEIDSNVCIKIKDNNPLKFFDGATNSEYIKLIGLIVIILLMVIFMVFNK